MCIKFNEESKVKNGDKWMFSYNVHVLKHEEIKCQKKPAKDFIKSERESKKADLL